MNLKEWLCGLGLVLVLTGQSLHSQQSEVDRKLLADIRAKAEKGDAQSQFELSKVFFWGDLGVAKDEAEAAKWCRKAAEQNHANAQYNLGGCYADGKGVTKDHLEAVKWLRKAADQNHANAQYNLGCYYADSEGVTKDDVEAVKWYRKAADQNDDVAQRILSVCYFLGRGVAKDYEVAYKWSLLAAAKGNEKAKNSIALLESMMTREQIAEGQKLARDFKPREVPSAGADSSGIAIAQTRPESSGTGFFITEDGYLITNEHVVREGAQVRLVTESGLIAAKVMKVDAANDLALLKAEGKF